MSIPAPRWDLSNVFPSLDSQEFKAAVDDYKKQVAELQDYFDEVVVKTKAKTPPKELASILGDVVAWDSVREPLAACMNGGKGEVITLNKRRAKKDALHSVLDQARLDSETLEAMLGAREASFPMFRKYFKHKAKLIGKEKLAWWDIFAPVGKAETRYTL